MSLLIPNSMMPVKLIIENICHYQRDKRSHPRDVAYAISLLRSMIPDGERLFVWSRNLQIARHFAHAVGKSSLEVIYLYNENSVRRLSCEARHLFVVGSMDQMTCQDWASYELFRIYVERNKDNLIWRIGDY